MFLGLYCCQCQSCIILRGPVITASAPLSRCPSRGGGGAGRGRGRLMRSAAVSPSVPRAPACVSCCRRSPPLSSVPRGPTSASAPALTPCLMFIVSIFPVLHLQTISLLPQHSTVSLTTAKECKSEYFHLKMQMYHLFPWSKFPRVQLS